MTGFLRRTPRTTLFVAGVVLILAVLALAYLLDIGGNDEGFDASVLGWLGMSSFATIVLAALMLRLVPRTEQDPDTGNKPARIGLVLSFSSLATVVAFWSGLPLAIGLPALVLGAEGRARAPSQGRGSEALVAMVVAGVAIAAGIVACAVG